MRTWIAIASVALASCGSPLVGGECLPGYTACAGTCVLLTSDAEHCGQCDNRCGAAIACVDGVCEADASAAQGSTGGQGTPMMAPQMSGGAPASSFDASITQDAALKFDASVAGDAASPMTGCGLGQVACNQVCADLDSDARHCGSCDVVCQDNELCSAGSCAAVCDLGWAACGGGCADVARDADHCGQCGKACASGICESGVCADTVAGQLVAIGHTYEQSNEFQDNLLGNAVFLADGAPVEVLLYEGNATAESIAGVRAAIDRVATRLGRAWQVMVADSNLVTLQLEAAKVFVICEQSSATDAELQALAQDWSLALSQFFARGGVVVLVEGDSLQNSGTHRVLSGTGVFQVGGRQAVSGEAEVITPGIGIALHVGGRYQAEPQTVGFIDVTSPGIIISRLGSLPIVFQRVIE